MSDKAEKLLEKLRANKKGVTRVELERLYKGFGFVISSGKGPHDSVTHPDFPMLYTSLPRHRKLLKYNVVQAVRLIDRLKELEKAIGKNDEDE